FRSDVDAVARQAPGDVRRDRVVGLGPGRGRPRVETAGGGETVEVLGGDEALSRSVQADEQNLRMIHGHDPPESGASRPRAMPRTAPSNMILSVATRHTRRTTTVTISVAAATSPGRASGDGRARETARTPTTAACI